MRHGSVVRLTVRLRSCRDHHGCRRRVAHEALDGALAVARGQVRIPLNDRQRLPAAQLLDREEIDAGHRETRSERVPDVV